VGPCRAARRLNRAPRHDRLATSRRGPRGSHGGVDGRDDEVGDGEDGPCNLLDEGHEPLSDLRGRARDGHDATVDATARDRTVHVALRVHEVLEPDGESDAAADVTGTSRASGAT